MNPSWIIPWLAYWTEEGCEFKTINGKIHTRDTEHWPTEDNAWLDCDAWIRGLTPAQLAAEQFVFDLEEYLLDRYCGRCKSFQDPEDLQPCDESSNYMKCLDCHDADEDADYYNRVGPYTYYGVKRSDF